MFISEKKNSAETFIQCWSNLGQFQECYLNIFYTSHKKVQAWYYLPTNSSNGVSEATGLQGVPGLLFQKAKATTTTITKKKEKEEKEQTLEEDRLEEEEQHHLHE